MKIHRSVAAIFTISIVTISVRPSVANIEPNTIEAQKFRNSTRTHRCQQQSEVPLPATYKQVKIKQSWCGTIPKKLRLATSSKQYITNNLEWTNLWKTYRNNETVPKIDFDRELILLYVHFDANSVEMVPAIAKENLAIGVSFTEAAMGDTPCTYMFASIDRGGIKTIDGKAIDNGSKRNLTGF
jgi:hypothetical protein